jgi:anti-sigma B factor antagonist
LYRDQGLGAGRTAERYGRPQLQLFGWSEEYESMHEEAFDDSFTINARRLDHEVLLVEMVGDLDLQTVAQAKAFLVQVTAMTPRHLIVDLSGVTFLSSSGMALLIGAQSGRDGIHGRLRLIGVFGNHPVERPLGLIGLLEQFEIAPDLATLMAELDAIEPV